MMSDNGIATRPLRLLYLAYVSDLKYMAGAGPKMWSQIRALRGEGIRARGLVFYFTSGRQERRTLWQSGITLVRIPEPPPGLRFLRARARRKALFRAIEDRLRIEERDLIYFRYPFADASLLRFMRRHGQETVFECNTIEPLELRRRPLGWLKALIERYYGPRVLRRARGIVGVTDEITLFERKRCAPKAPPAMTVSNGVDLDVINVRLRPRPYRDGDVLRLLMVANLNEYHGADLVLWGLSEYRGKTPLLLDIVGEGDLLEYLRRLATTLGVDDRVCFHGAKHGAALEPFFNTSHIALGAFGVHRKGLSEACTLKVREYLARGIPFVYSLYDTDLKRVGSPHWLEMPAGECPLDMARVVRFAQKALSNATHGPEMRAFARNAIEWPKKAVQLRGFLKRLNQVERLEWPEGDRAWLTPR